MCTRIQTTLGCAALAGVVALAGMPLFAAPAPDPSRSATGPHAPEKEGLGVHSIQGLRHPSARSTFRGGLTVKVTPRSFGPAEWTFDVVLDSHRPLVSDDLLKTTVLLADGAQIQPTHWEQTQTRKRHRSGVLTFPAPAGQPSAIEVRMQPSSEQAPPRVFRWAGAALASSPPHKP